MSSTAAASEPCAGLDALPAELLVALYGWLDRTSAGRLARTGRAMREASTEGAPLDDVDLSVRPATRADLWALLEHFPHARVQSLRLVRQATDHPGAEVAAAARGRIKRCAMRRPLAALLREPPFRALQHLAVTVALAGGSDGTARLLRACASLRSVELYADADGAGPTGRIDADVWRVLAERRASAVVVRVVGTIPRRFAPAGVGRISCGYAAAIARSARMLVLSSHAVRMCALAGCGGRHGRETPRAGLMEDCACRLRVLATHLMFGHGAPERGVLGHGALERVPHMPALEVLHLYGGTVCARSLLRWLVDGCPRLDHLCMAMGSLCFTEDADYIGGDDSTKTGLLLAIWRSVVPRLRTLAIAQCPPFEPPPEADPPPRLRRLLLEGRGTDPFPWIARSPLEELHVLEADVDVARATALLRDGGWPALRRLTLTACATPQTDTNDHDDAVQELVRAVCDRRPHCTTDVRNAVKGTRPRWHTARPDGPAPVPCPAEPFAALRVARCATLSGASFLSHTELLHYLIWEMLQSAL